MVEFACFVTGTIVMLQTGVPFQSGLRMLT
jgi:hypothetical protein